MKNRISKIILTAAVAATMLASSLTALAAGTASVSVTPGSTTVKPGETVSFTVSVSGDAAIAGANVNVSAESLTPAGAPSYSGFTADADETGFAGIASPGVDAMAVTYTYTVPADAEDGATYTVSATLTEALDDDANNMAIGSGSASATVTVAAEQEPGQDEPTTPDEPSTPDNPSNPGTPSDQQPSNPSTPSNQSSDKGLDDVPKTGDASSNMMVYAVVAIAAAGAIAIVSAKKLAR